MKTLALTDEQRRAIKQMAIAIQTEQLKQKFYINAILDQNNLKGTWEITGVTTKGLQVEKK